MNKIPVVCRGQSKVNFENSKGKLKSDSKHQISYDLLNEAVKEIMNDGPANENFKENQTR